ncbi:MAG: hypothetical protein KDB69_06710, partial [Acidimicrobiia bacterium]|nr:hypothetical protein [Acidimicrobiia bacterium]
NRAAYARLFFWVAVALQALGLLLIGVSMLVVPWWVGVTLLVVAGGVCALSWLRFRSNFMWPTFAGVAVSLAWMLVVGLGPTLFGWSP